MPTDDLELAMAALPASPVDDALVLRDSRGAILARTAVLLAACFGIAFVSPEYALYAGVLAVGGRWVPVYVGHVGDAKSVLEFVERVTKNRAPAPPIEGTPPPPRRNPNPHPRRRAT